MISQLFTSAICCFSIAKNAFIIINAIAFSSFISSVRHQNHLRHRRHVADPDPLIFQYVKTLMIVKKIPAFSLDKIFFLFSSLLLI